MGIPKVREWTNTSDENVITENKTNLKNQRNKNNTDKYNI